MTAPVIKGWCPGALRPMESGDGLIVRLKLTGGIVPLDLAGRIADWAQRFGNGEIDLTARANLQIRGVTDAKLPGLQDAIASAGLLDENPDGEAIRNVIASPLAGLDPDAVLDIRSVVAALETRLAGDSRLYALPAKFCFAVDDGGRLRLADVRADVRFEAMAGPAFVVRLDGAPDDAVGPCRPDEVPDVAAKLARVFLAQRGDARRMQDLVARLGVAVIAEEVGLAHASNASPPARGRSDRGSGWVLSTCGIGFPFGRILANNLLRLAERAAETRATEFRLTPWRTVLVPCPAQEAAALLRSLPSDAFILDPADPRRRVAACVGAPACERGTTSVRDDANRLAPLVPETEFLHVSGCAKGCAHPRPASVTLVGNNGRYDLIRDGAPSDLPVRSGLTLDEAAGYLREMAANDTQGRSS